MPNGLQQSEVIEPVHLFKGGQFQRLLCFPVSTAVDQFGFVQPVDRLGKGFVIAVTTAPHRELYASLGEALGVQDGEIL